MPPFRLSRTLLGFQAGGLRSTTLPSPPILGRQRSFASSTGRPDALPSQSLPHAARPSLWTSIVPAALRRRPSQMSQPATRAVREPNPATFYIVVFLLIGSQAIQMIALRKDYTALVRRADAKISLLNDVIRRVQEGEEVDVEGILGTGDPVKEAEWEEVIKQIENEELWPKKTKRSGTVSQYAAGTSKPESTDVKQSEGSSDVSPESQRASDEIVAFTKAPRGFY